MATKLRSFETRLHDRLIQDTLRILIMRAQSLSSKSNVLCKYSQRGVSGGDCNGGQRREKVSQFKNRCEIQAYKHAYDSDNYDVESAVSLLFSPCVCPEDYCYRTEYLRYDDQAENSTDYSQSSTNSYIAPRGRERWTRLRRA